MVQKIQKKSTENKNIITFLFFRVRSSSLESDLGRAETFDSEHFQTLSVKSRRPEDHDMILREISFAKIWGF